MAFFAEHDIPCAHPVASRDGVYMQTLKGKPAALVQRLPGRGMVTPAAEHCTQVGEVLARLHLAGRTFPKQRKNPRGPEWNRETATKLHGKLTPADRDLLDRELNYQQSQNSDTLPSGVIHADLFRDNALFTDDTLTGVIDLYYACSGPFLYDLAITVNDWCSLDDGSLNTPLADVLVAGYQRHRPITQAEKYRWEAMLRAGALRFWLSRLLDQHFPRSGELTHIKNPDRFRNILIKRIQEKSQLSPG
jgi:homoserine kinase type II